MMNGLVDLNLKQKERIEQFETLFLLVENRPR